MATFGATAWNVTVRSTVGASAAVPRSVTVQFAWAWDVLPVNVPDVMSLQPICLVPTSRHMWVFPCDEFVPSFAVTVPAPSLRKVTTRASPPGSAVASSLRPTKVSVARAGAPGEPDGAALGLGSMDGATLASGVGAAEGGRSRSGSRWRSSDGDPIATGGALGEPVAEPLRPTTTSIVTATTRTSSPARTATTLRRVRSLTGSSHACVRASYPTVGVTPAADASSQTRRRAIMAG